MFRNFQSAAKFTKLITYPATFEFETLVCMLTVKIMSNNNFGILYINIR